MPPYVVASQELYLHIVSQFRSSGFETSRNSCQAFTKKWCGRTNRSRPFLSRMRTPENEQARPTLVESIGLDAPILEHELLESRVCSGQTHALPFAKSARAR